MCQLGFHATQEHVRLRDVPLAAQRPKLGEDPACVFETIAQWLREGNVRRKYRLRS